jgi:hypothetical protein
LHGGNGLLLPADCLLPGHWLLPGLFRIGRLRSVLSETGGPNRQSQEK